MAERALDNDNYGQFQDSFTLAKTENVRILGIINKKSN